MDFSFSFNWMGGFVFFIVVNNNFLYQNLFSIVTNR
jgi:hypothetical protein